MANNDWREKYRAMMTDPDYAAKAAEAVGTTRKVNTDLMNKSAEDYPALSVGQQTKSPLDLSRVPEMQQEQAARATIDSNDEDYSGVVDLATKIYDEERTKRANKAADEMRDANNGLKSEWDVTLENLGKLKSAADISKTYEAVISNPSLQQAVRLNANKALVKALEANPSMSQEEQQKLFNETIDKQLQQMGEGIDKYLRGKNEVSGTSEYLIRSAANNSAFGKAMQLVAKNMGGSEGESAYQQQALADYDANKAKWWEQGLGTAGGLVLDAPLMQGIGIGVNATLGRGTMWGLSKVGGKALQSSLLGKVTMGMATGGGVLGGYNAVSTLQSQLASGYFNPSEIAASAGHGFTLGALTGAMSPWLRGVSAGMGKVGKVATMAGGLATEAGVFTASELSEMENPYDLETIAQVFGKNVAVVGGLKLSNLPKTVKEYKQWYTEGKQSNFTDADYKTMADFARANGYAADDAFTMSADGTYSRSVADRVTGNRTLLTMTKLQGGKEQNLAIEMYNDPNVPLSLKTKIAAKMNLPAPPPVLPNGVRVEGNKAITYYTMSNGQQQVIEVKEFDRPRKARAFANEFSRTTARRNDLLQSEASVNVMMSQPMVVARLNEQAKRNGTTLADEKARMDGILQRAADGTITQEDIAYYRSIVEDDVTTTESLKKDIKDKFGVEIDEVLNKEGNFTTAEDEALTAYGNALRTIIERGNPTTERTATAAMAGIEDYVALNNLGIEQTSAILANPEQRAAIEQQTRSHYAAWLKFFDGKMGEDALAQKLGLDLNNTSDLRTFLAEQTYYKSKAADRIAYNTAEAAKQLLEQGNGGVRFLDDGRVKLKGVPFAVEVSEDIVARYEAAKQGSGEPMQRIANDALKDIIKQSETPAEPKEPIAEEMPDVEEPMSESEAVTQQMVDARLAEIDTDLQGIEADGVQRMTINGKPVAIIKGRIVADENGQVDKTKSSAEVAYMLLDENGRPMLNEQGRAIIEVGVKPSNVRVENIEQWRSVDDYKASEEQRIRDNNRITDEAMRQVDEQVAVEEPKAETITEPQNADDLLAMCGGDKALALDVANDELAKAMQAKGKGATPAETIEINKRIRMYQQMVDRLSATEQPESAALPEAEQTEVKAEPQVTEDMEFVYQQGLEENHDGMEPMQTTDGRYKWIGLQRGELTANMGERDVELLDNLAKKLGVAVIPINVKDRAVNGYYKDGNIYVNTNRGAEWTMRWVAGHEMLHDVAKKSPEAYDAYKQAVLDMWGEEYIESQVKQIIEDYAKSGKTIDREQALTELVNDFGGDLFSSRDGLKILDSILKDQSSKGNTGFIDTIKKWWENIKEFFGVSPYANEVEKKLADAYKSAMENVDYQAKQEQVVKDMDDAFFGESTEVAAPKQVDSELRETKDYTPTKMPRGVMVGNKESKDYSVKQIMRGVGIDAQTDGDNVWFERDGKKFDKYNPMTIEESKSGILKNMVDQCMELGLMDEAKAEDVYKMYTGIVNKIIEKADGSFADLNNQYLWLGETVYKVVHSNSDKQYKRSLDVTLVCKKNEAVIRGISELQRRQGFGVTPSQIMQLYYSTLDKGFQVPCPVCYVFSRYIQNGQYISNLIYGHNKFDKDKYFKNPAKMSAKKKAEAEQYWLDRYNEALAWEEANKKLIADAKSVLSWATKEMDMLMLDAAKGNLDKAKRNEYKERAKKLDSWYRAALDLVAQSDMSGYIKSVIANPIVKDKKVVGMAMREDAGQKMTQEVEEAILDYRKVALAKTKYPHISRYIASKGSAAGKGFNFEGDNPMGDILQQLSTDSKNYFQEAMNATSEKERNKLMKSAKDRTMAAAKYAAQQSLRGGVRQWSWSDNIEALAPDVALNAMQIGMLGGAMQTYSKQLEGIEMMAAMGAYVNGSLMGKGMGYQKVSENYSESPKWQDPNTGSWYTLAFDDVVGVQPRSLNGKLGLFALNQMYDKAGNILVGMNDIHIRTAMADPRIFFIIPWHASGMSDHILKQMNSMLKLDMAGFKASDYTKHQEEKMYKEKKETDKAEEGEEEDSNNVTESTTALWRSHDYSDRFVNNDGTKANIAIEDGTLSADQLHYRELRDAIFMHSNAESAKDTDKAFWAEHQDWLTEIKNDIFLNQTYESVTNGPGRFGIAMIKDDCGFIYPYEYWDKASKFGNADINGQRYVEYCRRLGVKPKFSGVDGGSASEYGNFVDDAGYWKLLIDRRMYDRNGNYQDLTPVDASGFKADFIDQDKTSARFPVTVVADKEQTSNIVDDVQYNELKTYKKKKLKVDYKILPETAIKKAAEALMQYNQAKQLVSMTKTGKVSVKTQKELYELELERLANEEALADIENDDFMDNEGAEMSIVRDRNKIDELEGEELVPMYRTFQVLDGRLYPPMATIQAGKKVHSIAEGDWWKSDENPDLALVKVKGSRGEFYSKDDDRISKKDGQWVITIDGEDKPLSMNGNSLGYYFNLKKGEKGDVATDDLEAAYNPYIHSSKSALNDQFKGAYLRPNLVLVEVLVPKSELDGTNRYKADYAKDGIGEVPWNSGAVMKQIENLGAPERTVALSRYAKIGRVFTNAEWADKIDEELSAYKEQITLPFVAFPPDVLRELANRGYKVEPPTSKKAQPYYEAWLKGEQPTDPNGGGEPIIDGKRADESVLDYAKRMNEEGATSAIGGTDYSIVRNGKEYKNDGYTQRGNINLSRRANEAIEDGMTDIGKDNEFGRFIAENGLGEYDGEYHHVGQKFNTHYFARLNNGVTLASARKAYKKYLEDKSNKEVADVLKKYPDAIAMDGGTYRDYKEVAYAGGKFWFVPRGENEPRPTIYRELPQGDDVQFSIKGGNTPERRADKVAQLKQRIEQLSQEKDAIAEDGAKVKDIASEMTSFIKQNISTEVQSDMTRNQFKGILNQLENAVTKQDLEKPMQMVEYIGANVARRALTRQMRDFVKNGFKALTPKGLAKPKTVDGVTSRVLGLVKTLYQSMNKNAFGSDLYKLQKQVREEKAKLEQFNADNGGKYKDVVDKVNEILAKIGVDRYEEMYKFFDEKQAAGDVDGEVLGYIGRMLPLLDSIELTKDQQKQAKADSAIVTKEDLDQLRTSLEEKRDKDILSEEDKAVLDNMPLYEAMLSLHQQQLNIDGPGASSLAMQMKAKVGEIKEYGKKLDELDNKNSKTAIAYKTRIKEANNELQELFAARIVDQKAVNANVGELLDNLKEIRDTGKSKLQEWSKAKQERATRLVKMANESFGKDAKGYWSEVDKRGKLKKDFINWANNLRLSVLMSPAMSFEYMLGVMDPRYYTNNSPIYKQFIKSSEGLIKANDNFFEGAESYNMAVNEAVERFINRNAMTNLKEYFRRGDRFATAIIPFEVKVSRNGVDEYIPKEEMMTRGQAAKIYAWSRMADGMAKLKAHGVTDNTLTKIKEFIGEDYMNFIDWVEDEFFPRLRRERYNPVYKQMYGISMAENDHYFPFLIYQKDVRTEQELEVSNNDTLGGGVVGNLVERKRNNARLDFTAKSPDIFDMITDYGRKMEEWTAYAQVREDLKKVVNDKQFKQHCDELGTHYYKYFLEAAQVASRLSRDMAMTQHTQSGWAKAQKTIASAAISLRVSTALKQLLSAPAFMVYSLDPAFHHELIKTAQPIDVESAIRGLWKLAEGDMGEAKKLLLSENWVGHYNWCVENLPSFRERVTLGGAGNPILEEKGFFKFADDIQSVGMLPNRLVDAFTCSVGAKAIYEYAFKKYKKNYSEKTAHNMAVTDAEIAFNSSQQSSNPVFLAPMQVSKQFLLRGMMNYKNSPIGYYRNAMKASIDMYRATKAIFGQPKFTINGEVYGFENDGKNPFAMAAESGARASMFWLFLNLIWNFGTVGVAGISYTMLNGSKNDDGNMFYTDEEIKKALGNDMGWALFNASNQGIPWVSGFSSAAQTGQDYTPSILFSEMNNYVEQINKDGFMSMATAQIFTDLLLKNAAGVDPEVWGQIYRGAQGIMEDRPMRIEDFMNLIASPRSAISGVTKQRVGEYDRLRDYVNDRIASNRQLGVDERMAFGKKLTGMRELSKKSLGMYVDEYLADKIPGYREFANKPTEMEKEKEVANSNTLNAASSLYETIVRKEEEKEEKKDKIKDRSTKRKIKVLTKVANVIHKLCEVNDFETAERVANEMERRVKRGYNPDGETIEERLKNVNVWDSTGTTEQRSADGFSTAFDRARKGGFDSYLRRGKD